MWRMYDTKVVICEYGASGRILAYFIWGSLCFLLVLIKIDHVTHSTRSKKNTILLLTYAYFSIFLLRNFLYHLNLLIKTGCSNCVSACVLARELWARPGSSWTLFNIPWISLFQQMSYVAIAQLALIISSNEDLQPEYRAEIQLGYYNRAGRKKNIFQAIPIGNYIVGLLRYRSQKYLGNIACSILNIYIYIYFFFFLF